jgi:hypothetical protein
MIRRTVSVAEWPSKRGRDQAGGEGRVAGRAATEAMVGL